jgi:hypothetical protein
MVPGSIWRNTANKRQHIVVAVGKFPREDKDYIVHREWPIPNGPDQIISREDWEHPCVSPICTSCQDTHHGAYSIMCNQCPIPCNHCRGTARSAFCHRTPCSCDCHADNWQYRKWHAEKKTEPLFVKEMCDTGDNQCLVCGKTKEGNLK